eukprot:SAG11_NODE_23688_length_384_cov_1.238596_1_plen_60_part_00
MLQRLNLRSPWTNRCVEYVCDTSVGIFHRKMELAPDVGGTEVPATMAGKMWINVLEAYK